jgi:signal transduction histidine kinase
MFIFLYLLSVVSTVWAFIRYQRIGIAKWLPHLLLGWMISLTGYTLFLSKYVGLTYSTTKTLFVFYEVRYFIAMLPVTPGLSSSLVTIGRSVMSICFLGCALSLDRTLSGKSRRVLGAINTVLAVANVIFYLPPVYSVILKGGIGLPYIFNLLFRTWVISAIIFSAVLMARTYWECPIPIIRIRLGLIILGVLSLQVYYIYTVFLGPVQFLDLSTYFFIFPLLEGYEVPFGIPGCYIFSLFTAICLILCTFSIWKYSGLLSAGERADRQLEQRLTAFNPGVKIMTHAIKNKIISLKMLAEESKDAMQHSNAADVSNHQVLENIEQIIQISDDTLERFKALNANFKRFSLRLQPLTLIEIIAQTVESITIPPNITLNTKIIDGETRAFVDLHYFREALSNIITNACEAIGNRREGMIIIRSHVSNPWIALEVEDNGPGIPEERIAMIFEPFYTNKNSSNNWGIGLSYAKLIVYRHMGQISVNSIPGDGTVFTVLLPNVQGGAFKRPSRHRR